MKTELAKLIDKWEIEKGSYIPNAPIYQAFIDEAKEALERESQVNNVVSDNVVKRKEMNKEKIQYAFFKAYTKPLPFYRILLYSFDENAEWYRQRVKKYLK